MAGRELAEFLKEVVRGEPVRAETINAIIRAMSDEEVPAARSDLRHGRTTLEAYATISVPKYSLFGLTSSRDLRHPQRVTIDKIGDCSHGSPFALFTNGSLYIKAETWGVIRPVGPSDVVTVRTLGAVPLAGDLCGVTHGSFAVDKFGAGLVCLSDAKSVEGVSCVNVALAGGLSVVGVVTQRVSAYTDTENESSSGQGCDGDGSSSNDSASPGVFGRLGRGKVRLTSRGGSGGSNLQPLLRPQDGTTYARWEVTVWNHGSVAFEIGDVVLAVPVAGIGLVVVASVVAPCEEPYSGNFVQLVSQFRIGNKAYFGRRSLSIRDGVVCEVTDLQPSVLDMCCVEASSSSSGCMDFEDVCPDTGHTLSVNIAFDDAPDWDMCGHVHNNGAWPVWMGGLGFVNPDICPEMGTGSGTQPTDPASPGNIGNGNWSQLVCEEYGCLPMCGPWTHVGCYGKWFMWTALDVMNCETGTWGLYMIEVDELTVVSTDPFTLTGTGHLTIPACGIDSDFTVTITCEQECMSSSGEPTEPCGPCLVDGGTSSEYYEPGDYTFTAPSDGWVNLTCFGGGGGGSTSPGNSFYGGGGGGGGCSLTCDQFLASGEQLFVRVGAGGGSDTDGADSLVAESGGGATLCRGDKGFATISSGGSGLGGSHINGIGDFKFSGGAGGSGVPSGGGGGGGAPGSVNNNGPVGEDAVFDVGGAGASSGEGTGGSGGGVGGSGTSATGIGAGGGGSGGSGGSGGGTGANGAVYINFCPDN